VSDPEDRSPSNRVPAWRVAAAVIVLAAIGLMGAILIPVYSHNWELEKFLHQVPPASDDVLRQTIIDKGRSLSLEIMPDHLQIHHLPGATSTDVHYVVRVSLPLYTVDLHFSSTTSGTK
jgi:hypothetical protein